jgi:hypothetical protein
MFFQSDPDDGLDIEAAIQKGWRDAVTILEKENMSREPQRRIRKRPLYQYTINLTR